MAAAAHQRKRSCGVGGGMAKIVSALMALAMNKAAIWRK